MNGDKVRASVRLAEDGTLRAYRLWFEHTRRCADGCKGARKALDGCESGRELWASYRHAYAGGDLVNWQIERVPGSRVHRTDNDRVALPLRLFRNGEHATDAELRLSPVEAEHLYAALCRVLDGHPAPPAAPDCRTSVEPADALSAKAADANRRSRRAL